ncbi:hypothetical protein DFH06DRAFT_1343952 [Mycena polygramma]|nr:hypothetical protein DFH06DRAFT_1343952 [Mycena polygramma]
MSSLGPPLFDRDHGTWGMNGLFSSMSISRTVPSTRTARLNSGPAALPRQRILYDRPVAAQYRARHPRAPLATIAPATDNIAKPEDNTPSIPLPPIDPPNVPVWVSTVQAATSAAHLSSQLARRQKRLEQDAYRTAKWGAAILYRRELLEREHRSPSATRVRRPGTRRADGYRELRAQLVTAEDLYYTAHLPPAESTERAHQKCGICLQVKSHPVSYNCGHGHCYVCIRLWLRNSWECPTCRTTMLQPPHRNYDNEAAIALDFPNRADLSIVDYSFKGLYFPKRRPAAA